MRRRRVAAAVILLGMAAGVTAWTSMGAATAGASPFRRTVLLKGQPAAVAVDERLGHAFVATLGTSNVGSHAGGSVDMLDARTGKLLHSAPLPILSWSLVVDERNARVFAVGANSGGAGFGARYTVRVLDARTGAVVRTVAAWGVRPSAIAVDERAGRVFIVNSGPLNNNGAAIGHGSVSVLDARDGTVIRSVAVGTNPVNIAVDEATARVFVLNSGATFTRPGSVSVLDACSGPVLRTVPVGPDAGMVALDERSGRAFVASAGGVSVLNARSGALLRTSAARADLLAVDERAGRVFAIDRDGTLTILSARGGAVIGTVPRVVPAGDDPIGAAVDARSGRVVVIAANADGGSVSVLDARTGAPRRTIALGSDPAAVAVSARTGRAFIANAGDGALRSAQAWRRVPPSLRWLPFAPQRTMPKAPGSVDVLDVGP